MDSMPPAFRCPHCGEPLVWLPLRWFDRGCYHCNRCGGFPDIQGAPGAGNVAAEPPPVQRYGGHRPEVLVVDDDHRRSMILIVDPDESTRAELERELTVAGYLTATAADFATGMRALHAARPDLLIAALRLGGFNGLQYVAMSERPILTIILGAEPFDENESRSLGAQYLRKPVDTSTLVPLVRGMLAGKTSSAPLRRWVRKSVKEPVPARLGNYPARLLNVSYGGFCLAVDAPRERVSSPIEVTFPNSNFAVHAELAWRENRQDREWRCGAELPVVTDDWRTFVDLIS